MARDCSVCVHRDKAAIEAAMLEPGASPTAVGKRFGVTRHSVTRHCSAHVSRAIALSRAEENVVARERVAKGLLDRLEELVEKAGQLLEEAESSGEVRVALAAVDNLRRTLELIGKVTGEIDTGAPVLQFVLSPEWAVVENAIARPLENYPEARRAVRASLEEALANHRGILAAGASGR